MLISGPIFDLSKEYAIEKYKHAKEKNLALAGIYRNIAEINHCKFIDAAQIVKVGSDGVHFDEVNHNKFGKALANEVLKLRL